MPSQLIPFKVIRRPHETGYRTDVIGVKKPLFYRSYEVYGNLFSYLPYTFRDGHWFGQSMKLAELLEYPRQGSEDFTFYLAEKAIIQSATMHQLALAELRFENEAFHLKGALTAEWLHKAQAVMMHQFKIADNKGSEGIISSRFFVTELLKPKSFTKLKGLLSADAMIYHPSEILKGSISASSDRNIKEMSLTYLQQAVHEASGIITIERLKNAESVIEYRDTEFISLRDAEMNREDADIMQTRIDSDKVKKESHEMEDVVFSDKISEEAIARNHMTLLEKLDYEMTTVAPKMADNYRRDGLRKESTTFGERIKKPMIPFLKRMMIFGEREGKSSFREKWRVLDIVRRAKDGRKDVRCQLAVKKVMDATRMMETIFALLDYRDARVDRHVTFAESSDAKDNIDVFDAVITRSMIHASRVERHSHLKLALIELEKESVMAEFVELLLVDINEIEGEFIDRLIESDRHPIEMMQIELAKIAEGKSQKQSFFNKVLQMVKSPKNSGWVLQVVEAIHDATNRNAVITYLKNMEKRTPEGLLEFLETAEGKDIEALALEGKLGWNKDKPNRPAGLMDARPLAHWEIGWDDVMEEWKPGWDYLIMPASDYPYEEKQHELYDPVTGVPYKPLGPTNEPNVRVEVPTMHPFPEWAEVGRDEAWVEIFTYQDVLINILGLQRDNKIKIAGMTAHQALQFILRELYILLERASILNNQYQRMFRFVRWYAETITMQYSHTILMREYGDWTDGIVRTGDFTAPYTKTNMVIQSNGVIESIAATGQFSFTHESLVDGEFTFSIANILTAGSGSTVEFYIDGVLAKSYTSGVLRETYPVNAGIHNYEIVFSLGMGEQVKMSGFVATNSIFKQAYTEQVDDTDSKGLKAVDSLIQELINYYVKHHLHKSKGAMRVNQRKIWLN